MSQPKCHFCNRPAVGSVKMFMHGAFTELAVCELHAEELNKNIMLDMISLLTAPFMEDMAKMKSEMMQLPDEKIKERACPECYELLRTFIHPMLNSIHKTYHMGKLGPGGTQQQQIVMLEQKLNIAIKNQKFEEAAKLRDEIKKLKGSNEHLKK